MSQNRNTGSRISERRFIRKEGYSVECFSFRQALDVCKRNQMESFFSLSDVPKLSKKNQVEYEACSKFSETLLACKGIKYLAFENMTFDSDVAEFISKALSDYDDLGNMFFTNVEFDSPDSADVVGQALKRRKPNEEFYLSLENGDSYLFGPLMEASAVIGGKLEFRNLDVTFVDTTRLFRYWTLNASTVTSLVLSNISGLSDESLVVLIKGLRNVSSLSRLQLDGTKCSPGSLIILKESLSILLEKYEGHRFVLKLGNTGFNDAAIWKISELFLEYNKIESADLSCVTSSLAKRIISTRVIPNQTLYFLDLTNVQFTDENDFKLLFSALKTKEESPSMSLSADCFHQKDQDLLKKLLEESGDAWFY